MSKQLAFVAKDGKVILFLNIPSLALWIMKKFGYTYEWDFKKQAFMGKQLNYMVYDEVVKIKERKLTWNN